MRFFLRHGVFPKKKVIIIYIIIYIIIIKILLEYCGVSEKKLYNCIYCFFPVRSRSIMQKNTLSPLHLLPLPPYSP